MFRKGEISTETDKKPFIFTLAALAGCLVSGILILIFAKGDALGIFASVLLFIVAASAAAVLFAMVTDRAYIEDGTLHMSYMFKHVRMPLTGIGKVTCKDQVYYVFDKKGAVAGTINGKLTGIDKILFALDRSGILFV